MTTLRELMPQQGTFTGYKEINGKLCMIINEVNFVPLSLLTALVFMGDANEAKFKMVDRASSPLYGKFVLTGVKPINPEIPAMPASKIVDYLIGKRFQALEVVCTAMSFNVHGYRTITEARQSLYLKSFYRIKLF